MNLLLDNIHVQHCAKPVSFLVSCWFWECPHPRRKSRSIYPNLAKEICDPHIPVQLNWPLSTESKNFDCKCNFLPHRSISFQFLQFYTDKCYFLVTINDDVLSGHKIEILVRNNYKNTHENGKCKMPKCQKLSDWTLFSTEIKNKKFVEYRKLNLNGP